MLIVDVFLLHQESQLLVERKKAEELEGKAKSDKEEVKKLKKEREDLQIMDVHAS